jgi:hypothetical protein
MNDVKDAIDRIGQRFDPRSDGLAELTTRRHRVDVRRRITAGALALMVGVGGSIIAARAFLGSSTGHADQVRIVTVPAASGASPTPATAGGATCPTPTGDSPPQVVLGSSSAPAGSSVPVSGTFTTGERWLQLWWNADDQSEGTVTPPPWPATGPDLERALDPVAPGLKTELAAVPGPASSDDCSFRTRFTVPDVAPGRYQVLWVFGAFASPPGVDGFALYVSPVSFEVSP